MSTPATFNRMNPEQRRLAMLAAAMKIAQKPGGFASLERGPVAVAAGCSASLVNHYFANMDGLRTAVIKAAVASKNLHVIGQAIVAGHPAARRVAPALRKDALASLSA